MTQDEALEILKMGQNVFLTGPAGSGKTFLLNQYIKYLQDNEVPVAITASTGIAATHMNGRTIHSWAAIKTSTHFSKKELDSLYYNLEIRSRIQATKVLIIDEISMLDAKRFELVDTVCKKIRGNQSPFGGLQIVLCGDFFQLPPIPTKDGPAPEFIFNSRLWSQSKIVVCYLEKQFRQNDPEFLKTLNEIRDNKVSDKTLNILQTRYQKQIEGFTKPPRLYTHNSRVHAVNSFELAQIKSPVHTYHMTCEGDMELVSELQKSCLAPQELSLKKGAFVMFVKNNFDGGYVNGTLGTVTDFDTDNGQPIIQKRDGTKITIGPVSWVTEDENENVIARINQIPLRLAWAITIHKSQGMSLDCAEIDLSQAFTEGMGYVALSRVRSLSGIKLMGINEMALKVNEHITEFDKILKQQSESLSLEINALSVTRKNEAMRAFLAK